MGFVRTAMKGGMIGFGAIALPFGAAHTFEAGSHMREQAGPTIPPDLVKDAPEWADPAIGTFDYGAAVIRNLGGVAYRLFDTEDGPDTRSNLQFDFGHQAMLAYCGSVALRRGIRM